MKLDKLTAEVKQSAEIPENNVDPTWEQRIQILSDMYSQMAASNNLRGLTNVLAQGIIQLVPDACLALVWQTDVVKQCLHLVGRSHRDEVNHPLLKKPKLAIPYESLTGDFLAGSTPYASYSDIHKNNRFHWKELAEELKLRCMLLVRIPGEQPHETLAIINVYTQIENHQFTDDTALLLVNIAGSASFVFRNLKASLTLNTLERINISLGVSSPLAVLKLKEIAQIVKTTLRAAECSIFVRIGQLGDNTLALWGTTDPDTSIQDYAGVTYKTGIGMTGWVAENRKPLRIIRRGDPKEIASYPGLKPAALYIERRAASDRNNRSFLVVPILAGDELIGVIRAIGESNAPAFNPVDQSILDSVASSIGIGLVREKHFHDSMRALTHQLFAPLSAIRSNCRELERHIKTMSPPPRVPAVMRSMDNSCVTAFNVTGNFTIMRIIAEGGDIPVVRSQCSIYRLVRQTLGTFESALYEIGLLYHVDWASSAPFDRVLVDRDLVLQAVMNIVENAIKYSFKNTKLKIVAEFLNSDEEYVKVGFFSIGIPIVQEEKEKIFETGFRSLLARLSKKPGTGLGLAVARAIIEAHGGKIWAESTSNNDYYGADNVSFFFTLPCYRN